MSGRKVFTAGEVLQAADVNDFLMDQSVMVFAGTAARGSAIPSPTEGMVTYRSDDDLVEVYNGSSFVPVGGILQVVSTAKTDTFSYTSTSFTNITGLSVNITPTSASSKILVLADVKAVVTGVGSACYMHLVRDATIIFSGDAAGSRVRIGAGALQGPGAEQAYSQNMIYLDSPGTTSTQTYKVQIRNATAGTGYINRSVADPDSSSGFRSASSITVMEVAG